MKRLGAGEGGGAAAAPRGSHSWHLDLQVHQVNTSDVWVHADVYPMTSGVSLAVPNLAWKDFEEEVKPRSHDEAVVVVLATVLSNAKRLTGRILAWEDLGLAERIVRKMRFPIIAPFVQRWPSIRRARRLGGAHRLIALSFAGARSRAACRICLSHGPGDACRRLTAATSTRRRRRPGEDPL
eukprot:g19279.t1